MRIVHMWNKIKLPVTVLCGAFLCTWFIPFLLAVFLKLFLVLSPDVNGMIYLIIISGIEFFAFFVASFIMSLFVNAVNKSVEAAASVSFAILTVLLLASLVHLPAMLASGWSLYLVFNLIIDTLAILLAVFLAYYLVRKRGRKSQDESN